MTSKNDPLTSFGVDLEGGWIDRRIFSDPDVYDREQELVFGRCWLFLAEDSMIPEPGDYITTAMGEDPVIVCRDNAGNVRAFLNTCSHRGNRVCLFDRGKTSTFTCSYHGWSYNLDGELTGVPFLDEAYWGQLDKSGLGLSQVPRLENLGSLWFGSWDATGKSLSEYLGDLAWYLDPLLVAEHLGGLEVVGGRSSYRAGANWKILAENNAGDHYHTLTTHGSVYKLGLRNRSQGFEGEQGRHGPFEIAITPGHGIGGIETDPALYERELSQARALGPEAVDWVEERYRRVGARLENLEAKPYSFSHGNVFPNLSFFGRGGALNGRILALLAPRGPLETEVWQWYFVERDAPQVVRDFTWSRQGQEGQLASGLFAQDDTENWERVTESTRTRLARAKPFHLGMGMEVEGRWPGSADWDVAGMPGLIGPRFSEHTQRRFYNYWYALMSGDPI
jgi:phenylpropionate dioxygenase-like ring-hydroxylating dioxygenase large terminal subunit